jgi:YebC/PmpR family DNA-binding regulatory protein
MPKDNIERAVKKGTGELEGVEYVEITYEGYGPGGVAILIFSLTDNANRTVAEIRHKLSRFGGNLGASNSVSWMFERKGQIYLDASKYSEDAALEAALDAGAQDFSAEGEQFVVTTEPADMHSVKTALEEKGFVAMESEIASVPKNMVHVEGKTAESLVKLLEELEELDDVQKVAANCDVELEEAR